MVANSKNLADELFPDTVEDELTVIDIPPNERRLHTETYDFSISTIAEYLKTGDIYVPKFQRKYVWNISQASRLIESLIIQCPIPVIYLNQEPSEKLSVIDGNQRLTSIKLFLDNEFALKGLTAYPELDGNKFNDLDPRFRRHILNRTLRCITILIETHPQIKFDVFERLNTGSVKLNPQEIRHGIYHGPLIDLVDKLVKNSRWKKMSGNKTDNRMKGSELILRYLALKINRTNYKKPMASFLNSFCEAHNKISTQEVNQLEQNFLETLEKAQYIFGSLAFRTYDSNRKTLSKSINAALYDSTMVAIDLLNPDIDSLKNFDNYELLSDFHDLQQQERFASIISVGTSATSAVRDRIKAVKQLLELHLPL